MQNTELASREATLDAEIQRLQTELAETKQQLSLEQERRGEMEILLHTNPDTALPIYRVFYQQLEHLIEDHEKGLAHKPFAVALRRSGAAEERRNYCC